MDYLLALLQGLGIAAAIGIRPFLPVLLVGALAGADLGVDFDDTAFAFLEQTGFLLAILAGVVVLGIVERRAAERVGVADPRDRGGAGRALGGRLARRRQRHLVARPDRRRGGRRARVGDRARSLFGRVRARLDNERRERAPALRRRVGAARRGLSVLFPPLAVLIVAGLAWLLLGGRRRSGEKYAGLRILR